MLDQKLIDFVKPYQEYKLNDSTNLINIFQELSQKFPKSLPLKESDIIDAIKAQLNKLGYNYDNLVLNMINKTTQDKPYKWPRYHQQFIFNRSAKYDVPFDIVTYDKKMIELKLNNQYILFVASEAKDSATKKQIKDLNIGTRIVSDFCVMMPYDQQLINLFTLYALYGHQTDTLNSDILKYSAKLIYVQQSSISHKTKNNVSIKSSSYDFGKDTNNFLSNFNLESRKTDELPDVQVLDLIKYMSDLLNDRPVDSTIFNLITYGKSTDDGTNLQIVINQARQLHLENVLTSVPTDKAHDLIDQISQPIARRINHIWAINNQPDNDKNAHHKLLVHGTQNLSILNILGEGLLDHNTLQKKASKHYVYTGSGLGNGIYFARLDQAEKSYNYTSGDDTVYMFIADVAYHKIKKVHTYNGALKTKSDEDLVWGEAVGSYDRDELVAKHPSQIQLKYLLELH